MQLVAQIGGSLGRARRALSDLGLVEGVPKARPVAEAPQLDPHGRAVRAVLVRGHVAHVRAPAARIDAALEPRALPAPNRRGILVAIQARTGGIGREQPFSACVGARAVEHQRARPALAQGVEEVAADVGVLRRAEGDVLHRARAHAAAGPGASRRVGLRGAPSPGVAGLRARARQRLAVDAVAVGVAGVVGVLGGGLVGVSPQVAAWAGGPPMVASSTSAAITEARIVTVRLIQASYRQRHGEP